MNAPLRRIALFCIVMVLTLMVSTTYIQFFNAKKLQEDPLNRRTAIAEAGRPRGPILAGQQILAESKEVADEYGSQRVYPGNALYSHITGFYTVYGTTRGLEQEEAQRLTGSSDAFFYRRVTDLLTGKEPAGAAVETTINPAAQQAAWDALGDRRGAVVALDPSTGAILAMVSKPAYDPNSIAVHNVGEAQAAYTALDKNPNKPLLNRALQEIYPPGSVFKVVMSAAALESGRYSPDTLVYGHYEIDIPGSSRKITNSGNHLCADSADNTTLSDALRGSCNPSFADLADKLGIDAVREQAKKFGFGQELKVPMNAVKSQVPVTQDRGQLMMTGIGQYDVKTSPLQVAMISAGVANGGTVMEPYLIKAVRAQDETVIEQAKPKKLSQAMSGRNAALLRRMMRTVVESGTARGHANIPGVAVAGKTGTAQHGDGKQAHAWFTSFAPAGDGEEAKVAVAVFVEEGGSGGRVAAPIAKKVIEAVLGQ